MKVFITGASGFSGRYLIDHIKKEAHRSRTDIEISCLVRSANHRFDEPFDLYDADICDSGRISDIISVIKPDIIIHLAGVRNGEPGHLFSTNVLGTSNILEAVRTHCKFARFLYISSSAVYGYAGEKPISEDTPLRPLGDYGISKAAGEMEALSYFLRYGMNVAVVRPFNLLGPGQDESFVTGKIIRQTLDIVKGRREVLDLYSIDSSRDFIDVRDAVSAYWKIVSIPEFESMCAGQVFNTGFGKSASIGFIISLLEEVTGQSIKVNLPDSVLPEQIPSQKSDNTKIVKATGWNPKFELRKTLSDMLDYSKKSL